MPRQSRSREWSVRCRSRHHHGEHRPMSDINTSADDLIIYLLAEIRCAARRAKLAADDLVAIGLGLKGGLISPYQALMHIEETDAFRFLGRPTGDDWGPDWAESARTYHDDHKRSEKAGGNNMQRQVSEPKRTV